MRHPNHWSALLILLLLLAGCGQTPPPAGADAVSALRSAEWMLGNWENRTAEGTMAEVWIRENDSVFRGAGFFIAGGDTVFSEGLLLTFRNGRLEYVATVSEQNGGDPVRFINTVIAPDRLVFENPGHDFPTKIEYRRIAADSIVAFVSGKKNNSLIREEFPLKRAELP